MVVSFRSEILNSSCWKRSFSMNLFVLQELKGRISYLCLCCTLAFEVVFLEERKHMNKKGICLLISFLCEAFICKWQAIYQFLDAKISSLSFLRFLFSPIHFEVFFTIDSFFCLRHVYKLKSVTNLRFSFRKKTYNPSYVSNIFWVTVWYKYHDSNIVHHLSLYGQCI